jgi:hypothetical protein
MTRGRGDKRRRSLSSLRGAERRSNPAVVEQTPPVVPAKAGNQYSRELGGCVAHHQRARLLGRPVKPCDDCGVCGSILRASVIAARKSLRVNGGFSEPPSKRKREAERRKAHLNRAAACSPDCRKQRHTATPLSVPPRRLLRPWDLTSERGREQARHPGRLSPTLHPSRPATEGSAP